MGRLAGHSRSQAGEGRTTPDQLESPDPYEEYRRKYGGAPTTTAADPYDEYLQRHGRGGRAAQFFRSAREDIEAGRAAVRRPARTLPTIWQRLARQEAEGRPRRLGGPRGDEDTVRAERERQVEEEQEARGYRGYVRRGIRDIAVPLRATFAELAARLPAASLRPTAPSEGAAIRERLARQQEIEAEAEPERARRHPVEAKVGRLAQANIPFLTALLLPETLAPRVAAALPGATRLARTGLAAVRAARTGATFAGAGATLDVLNRAPAEQVARHAMQNALFGAGLGALGEGARVAVAARGARVAKLGRARNIAAIRQTRAAQEELGAVDEALGLRAAGERARMRAMGEELRAGQPAAEVVADRPGALAMAREIGAGTPAEARRVAQVARADALAMEMAARESRQLPQAILRPGTPQTVSPWRVEPRPVSLGPPLVPLTPGAELAETLAPLGTGVAPLRVRVSRNRPPPPPSGQASEAELPRAREVPELLGGTAEQLAAREAETAAAGAADLAEAEARRQAVGGTPPQPAQAAAPVRTRPVADVLKAERETLRARVQMMEAAREQGIGTPDLLATRRRLRQIEKEIGGAEQKYRRFDDAALEARHNELTARLERSASDLQEGTTPWTRWDANIGAMRSGTGMNYKAGRAVAAMNRDARLVDEVLDELARRRGVDRETVAAELSQKLTEGRQQIPEATLRKNAEEVGEFFRNADPETWAELGGMHPAVLAAVARTGLGAAVGGAAGAVLAPQGGRREGAAGGALAGAALLNAPAAARALIQRSSLARRLLLSRGNLPQDIFELKLKRDFQVAVAERVIAEGARDLRRAGRAVYGMGGPTDAQFQAIDGVLKAEIGPSNLPPALRGPVQRTRNDIDVTSQRLIRSGAISDERAATVTGNLGRYVTRSYRIFDDAAFARWRLRAVDQAFGRPGRRPRAEDVAAVNRVVGLLTAEMPTATRAEVEGTLRMLLDKKSGGPLELLRAGKLGSKDLSILMHRKDIAPEIRALWGEYRDPRVNYARSMQKMANLIANHEFLRDVRASGLGRHFFEQPTGEASRLIAAEASDVMWPLNGLYTTPEIAEAFTRQFAGDALPWWANVYMIGNGATSIAKTVGSAAAQVRNFVGNVLFAVANGQIDAGSFREAARGVLASVGVADTAAWREYVRRVTGLGVIGESANANELRAILRDMGAGAASAVGRGIGGAVGGGLVGAGFGETQAERLRNVGIGAAIGAATFASPAGPKLLRAAETLYRLNDDFWKIYGFENDLARYGRALPGLPRADLEQRVATIVRDTYPTYSLAPEATKQLRRLPGIGQFVTWPSEVVRTLGKTIDLTRRELATPELRAIGARRLAGLIAVGAIVPGGVATGRLLTGMSRQDEDDLRHFLPKYQRNSSMIHVSRDSQRGQYAFLDLGYSDPYSVVRRSTNALLRGEPAQAGYEVTRTFFGEEILFKALIDNLRNRTPEGWQVTNPEGGTLARNLDYAAHLGQALEPGTLTSARRIARGFAGEVSPAGRAYRPGEEAAAVVTGQRLTRIDIPQALAQRAAAYLARKGRARNILTRVAGSRGTVSPEQLRSAQEESRQSEEALFESFVQHVQAARRLLNDDRQIRRVLAAAGLTVQQRNDLFAGTFRPFRPTNQWLRSRVEAARARGDLGASLIFRGRREEVRSGVDVALP